jgi:hypothetical protein
LSARRQDVWVGIMPRGKLVAPHYQAIFSADPLLLSDQHQVDYGRAMLKHLLVYRPLTTSKPNPIDLQKGAVAAPAAPLPTITAAMRQAYLRSRQERIDLAAAGLSEQDIDVLRTITMTSDGSTKERANNAHKNHEAIRASLGQTLRDDFDNRLRFAAIGLRVPISKLRDRALLGEKLCSLTPAADRILVSPEQALNTQLERTRAVPGASLDDWHDAVRLQVEKSLGRKSQIAVLPEFGLPPARNTGNTIEAELHNLSRRATWDHFVFGGTRHEDRYNRGPIVSKYHHQDSARGHWHYKLASARGLGENVLGPAGKQIPSYQSSVWIGSDQTRVAIAVCYDAYDPTVFLNLFLDVVRNFKNSIPRIILVPSFNPSSDFVALLRDLSFLARCGVVYVNALHGDSTMYMCGFDVADFEDKLPLILSSLVAREQQLQADIAPLDAKSKTGVATSTELRELYRMDQQRVYVQNFARRLNVLKSNRDLDHIVTFEDCPTCKARTPHTDMKCFRDIQYYNLHPVLMAAIFEFRRFYFGDEAFLPEPLRWDNLEIATKAIDGP